MCRRTTSVPQVLFVPKVKKKHKCLTCPRYRVYIRNPNRTTNAYMHVLVPILPSIFYLHFGGRIEFIALQLADFSIIISSVMYVMLLNSWLRKVIIEFTLFLFFLIKTLRLRQTFVGRNINLIYQFWVLHPIFHNYFFDLCYTYARTVIRERRVW